MPTSSTPAARTRMSRAVQEKNASLGPDPLNPDRASGRMWNPPRGQSGARARARGGAEEEQRAGTGSDLAVHAARKREVEVARADLDVAELRGALEHDARLLGRMAVGR